MKGETVNISKLREAAKKSALESAFFSAKKVFSYDAVSASVIIWVPKSGESKSGQMVSEKVIWS